MAISLTPVSESLHERPVADDRRDPTSTQANVTIDQPHPRAVWLACARFHEPDPQGPPSPSYGPAPMVGKGPGQGWVRWGPHHQRAAISASTWSGTARTHAGPHRLLRRSFSRSFHQALLNRTRPDSTESRPTLTCPDPTGPERTEDWQFPPKQQVAGSSPARAPERQVRHHVVVALLVIRSSRSFLGPWRQLAHCSPDRKMTPWVGSRQPTPASGHEDGVWAGAGQAAGVRVTA
jgi:hypothetical protein